MKVYVLVLGGAALAGCGQKPTATYVPPQTDYSQKEIDRSARVGDPAAPGREAYNQGKLSDQELVELEARRHRAAMSSITAQAVIKDMKDAERDAKVAAGLVEPPMTEEQKAKRLAEIRKTLDDIRARAKGSVPVPLTAGTSAQAQEAGGSSLATAADSAPTPQGVELGLTLIPLRTVYRDILVERPPGFLVSRVEKDGAAARAGVREGDLLIGTNGVWFTDCSEENLKDRLQALRTFRNPKLNVLRGPGFLQELALDVQAGGRP